MSLFQSEASKPRVGFRETLAKRLRAREVGAGVIPPELAEEFRKLTQPFRGLSEGTPQARASFSGVSAPLQRGFGGFDMFRASIGRLIGGSFAVALPILVVALVILGGFAALKAALGIPF